MSNQTLARKNVVDQSRQPVVRLGLGVATLLLAALLLAGGASGAGSVEEANVGKGGEPLEVASLAVRGKTTLIEFYSPFCPPCLQLAPLLEQLSRNKDGLAIKKVNINRPEVKGIDWQSPLAKQYRLRGVPHFMIFNPSGKLSSQDEAATQEVGRWLKEAGLLKD